MDYFPGNWGNPRTREGDLFTSNDYFPGKVAGDLVQNSNAQPISRTQLGFSFMNCFFIMTLTFMF